MYSLGYGEVLWDIGKDGATLGGAPLNVLGHITQLGGYGFIVSRVGDDELGRKAFQTIDSLNINRDLTHVDENLSTGIVTVALDGGIPTYTISTPAAWDSIVLSNSDLDQISKCQFDVMIYGTLAQRNPVSMCTLQLLLKNVHAKYFFFDVNLRLSFYSHEIILEGLKKATIVKMNVEEVSVVASIVGVSPERLHAFLISKFTIKYIIVTQGNKGTTLYQKDRTINQPARDVAVIDTVGAGDRLSAGFLYNLCTGIEPDEARRRASLIADYVVQK